MQTGCGDASAVAIRNARGDSATACICPAGLASTQSSDGLPLAPLTQPGRWRGQGRAVRIAAPLSHLAARQP